MKALKTTPTENISRKRQVLKTAVTASGFEYGYDERTLSDFRYLTSISRLQKAIVEDDDLGAVTATNEVMECLLGREQVGKLMNHIADQNEGYVPTEKIMAEFNEILESSKDAKN